MTPDPLEVALRLSSAGTLTIAAVVIWRTIRHRDAHPVWWYTFEVVAIIAAWRWIVVALLRADLWPEAADAIGAWVQPINQALYTLLGVVFIVLMLTHAKARGWVKR